MSSTARRLLAAEAVVDLGLGVALLLVPAGVVDLLGLPPAASPFYATVLGGVLLGIGVALLVESRRGSAGVHGLGVAGATAIDASGGLVLLGWLVFGDLRLPLRGQIVLWLVALLVLGLGAVGLATGAWRDGD